MRGHEDKDIELRFIWISVGTLLVTAIVLHVGLWWMYDYLRGKEAGENVRRSSVESHSPIPPDPKIQLNPQKDWLEFKKAELELLNTYGWASREDNRARIPIDLAMELLVERGLQ